MSRYVHLNLDLTSLDQVADGLRALDIAFEHGREQVMLRGSLECAGEPVDIRVHAGVLDAIEDFGFVLEERRGRPSVRLVCGELDRSLLEERLVRPVMQHVAAQAVEQAAAREGLEVVRERTMDGAERIVVKRR